MASDADTTKQLQLALQQAREEAEKDREEARKAREEAENTARDERMALQHERRAREKAEKTAQHERRGRQEAEKTAQDKRRGRQEAEDKDRGLSWPEALSVWHNLFSNPTIRYRYTTIQPSAFTKANRRHHPAKLVHWTNFHQEHKKAFTNLSNQFRQPEVAAFESCNYYKKNASTFMPRCLLNDEVALVDYEQRTVEELVDIAWHKKGGDTIGFKRREDHALDDVTSRLEEKNWHKKGGDTIGFKRREDHALDDITSRLEQKNTGTKPKAKTPTMPDKSRRLYEKVCYIIVGQGQRRNLYVIEYKSADKFTPALVLEGMHDMSIHTIIHRDTTPTDEDEKRKQKAEDSIAVVLTQTFDYMIDLGLSYGYVITGKTFIFLFIRPEDPQTLFYETVILKDPIEDLSTTSSILPFEQLPDDG